MGKKDIVEKMLAEHNDVFADIVNVLLFDGKNLICEEDLINAKDKSQYKADGRLHEQERDLSKIWQKSNVAISFLGMENQTKIDPYMPLRVIGYDGAVYRSQYREVETTTYPVITMVLNFGKYRWKDKKKLSDIMEVRPELQPYFQDYAMNVWDISYLSEEQLAMFQSDFGIVAEFFVKTRLDPVNYQPKPKKIKHVNEILKLLEVFTGDARYQEVANMLEEKGGEATMCEVLDLVEKRGIEQGIERGIEQGIERGIEQGIERGIEQGKIRMLMELVKDGEITIEVAAKKAGMPEETFRLI